MKAGELGHTEAQFYVAEAYRNGRGTSMHIENSLVWYKKSADNGHVEAMFQFSQKKISRTKDKEQKLAFKFLKKILTSRLNIFTLLQPKEKSIRNLDWRSLMLTV